MGDPSDIWPDTPPEIPPPRWPGEPEEPDPPHRTPTPLRVPLVMPAHGPAGRRERNLHQQRTVLLTGALDDDAATTVAAEVMTFDAEGDDDITLHLTSTDGDLVAALMLAEVLDLANAPVTAIAKGIVGGVALAPFAAADRRVASPRATFRMTEPRMSFDLDGTASQLTTAAEEVRRQLGQLHRWIAAATGKPEEEVADDLERGRILDAEEALAYGLVDEILSAGRRDAPRGETSPDERDPGGRAR